MSARNTREIEYNGLSLSGARQTISAQLARVGVQNASHEARLLVQSASGLTSLDFILQEKRSLSLQEATLLEDLISRRLMEEPLSRIEGVKSFYGRQFHVTTEVLDPRPETELLVDVVREVATASKIKNWPQSLLDIGTGSGCLLVTLLAELGSAYGVGTDICFSALKVARNNAHLHKVENRISFLQRRSLNGIEGAFDVLVSNPPYIPSGELKNLEAAVRNFDPPSALDGGEDGLSIYREIASHVLQAVPSGWIVLEVGWDQALAVGELFQIALGERMEQVQYRKDLNGFYRCVAIQTRY